MRFGLCCIFTEEPIRFRRATATHLARLGNREFISQLVLDNVVALGKAVDYCLANGIGSFRINSHLFPCATHPDVGYTLADLSHREAIEEGLCAVRGRGIRLTFHPDQYVVINSPREEVVEKSIAELEHQGWLAEAVGADVINIHAGGGYGDKPAALERFMANFGKLSERVRSRLTVENDDKIYTPMDLLDLPLPLVYDVHHHRCLPDGLSIEEATERALATWDREPLFHISSPREERNPRLHADYIDPADFPSCWRSIDPLTVEVEAKAKELAVLRLKSAVMGA